MPPHPSSARRSSLNSVITSAAFVAVCCSAVISPVRLFAATDHFVPAISGARTIDNNFDGGIVAGDTITLASGTHGSITFRNLTGTAGSYVVIRNDQGAGVTIQGQNTFNVTFTNCKYVKMDGSAKLGLQYGIKIRPSIVSPTAQVKIGGTSTFCTIRYVEVDGRVPSFSNKGIGISLNDHNVSRTAANEWREGFLIEHNYVHHTAHEGLYIGPNYANAGDGIAAPPLGNNEWPLRNIEIAYNLVTDVLSGIKLKSTYAGINKIHHNVIERTGNVPDDGTGCLAISLFSGSNDPTSSPVAGDPSGQNLVYNNRVEAINDNGISVNLDGQMPDCRFNVSVYNNVIVDPAASKRAVTANRAFVDAKIYNNTVIRADGGILVHTDAFVALVQDNLLAASGGISSPVTPVNNWSGTVAQAAFAGASDFHLTSSTPLTIRDAGSASGFPATDYDDVTRPQGSAADIGAYEFFVPTPAAPSSLGATAVSSSTINLTWTDNANNETGFEVDRALNSSFTTGLVVNAYTTGANPSMPVPATGLAANTTYYFRARATNAAGDSANSNTASATTQAAGIAWRAAWSATSGGSAASSIVLNKPAGVVNGDFMLAGITVLTTTVTIGAPSGWILVKNVPDGSMQLAVYKKKAGASEPGSYTFTLSSSQKVVGGIVAFSGVNGTTPIQVENGVNHTAAASTTHTTPTIATTGSGTWLVSFFGDRTSAGSTWSPPGGSPTPIERVDVRNTTSAAASLSIHTQGPVAAGNKSHTATASVSSDIAAMEIVALQP